MTLMAAEGSDDTLAPSVMVSLVVLASLFAAWRYLDGSYATRGSRREGPVIGRTAPYRQR